MFLLLALRKVSFFRKCMQMINKCIFCCSCRATICTTSHFVPLFLPLLSVCGENTIVFLWQTGLFFVVILFCRTSRAIALWIWAPRVFLKTSDEMRPTASKSSLSPGDDFVAGQRRNLDGGAALSEH